MSTPILVAAVLLAIATYALRYAGLCASDALQGSDGLARQMDRGVVILLAAVSATSALFDGHELADPSRAAGVVLGGTAALLRLPLVVVVLVAGGSAALLRMI